MKTQERDQVFFTAANTRDLRAIIKEEGYCNLVTIESTDYQKYDDVYLSWELTFERRGKRKKAA